MAIVAADIVWRYSGGVANVDPTLALGGAMSTAGGGTIDTGVLHDLFDAVSSAEALAGDTEYRGIFIENTHGTLTYSDARVYFTTAADDLDVAIAGEAINTAEEVIANENTAPVGEVFTHPLTYAAGLALNGVTGLAPGDEKGLWVRRTIPAVAPAETSHSETLRVEGDTT